MFWNGKNIVPLQHYQAPEVCIFDYEWELNSETKCVKKKGDKEPTDFDLGKNYLGNKSLVHASFKGICQVSYDHIKFIISIF